MFLTTFNIWTELLSVIGGLGIFLFGINLMGDSLKALAGNKMKMIIEKTTNTPLKGILVGAGVTALIQSSSGTTALTVGLVRAGLMTFPQAIGVIMGANIGTTVTSLLIGLNIGKYALIFVGIGAMMIFFTKKKNVNNLGGVLLGFGFLFFGLETMGDALKNVLTQYNDVAQNIFVQFGRFPLLGVLIGTVLTAVIQSSSAAIGILQSLYSTSQIQLIEALPIMLGANIGTTVTAILASIGGTVPAKRTAVVHTLFNVFGALLFLVLLRVAFAPLMGVIESNFLVPINGENPKMTIAIAHIIFNVVSTFVLFFFIRPMSFIAVKMFPEKEKDETLFHELSDYSLIEKSPALALEFVNKAITYMGGLTMSYYELARNYSFEKVDNVDQSAEEFERTINSLDKKIHDYLIKITIMDLNKVHSNILSKHLDTIKDLERIADHCSNIVEFFDERYADNQVLSSDGADDLKIMYNTLDEMIEGSIKAYPVFDKEKASIVGKCEDKVDKLEETFRKKHVIRINNGTCSYSNSDHFVEILSNLERIGDHTNNIATNIINDEYCQFDEFNH